MANFAPSPLLSQERSRIDLDNIPRQNRLVTVKPHPRRIVLHGVSSLSRDDTVIPINEESGVGVVPCRPTGSTVRLNAEKREAEVGSHHLSVSDPTMIALGPNENGTKRSLRERTKATRYLHRSEERYIEDVFSHRVVKTVSCIYQIDRGLVLSNTDRCHPFFGRWTAKKPVGLPQLGVNQLVKRTKKIDRLIIDE
jgi:hypothetical protein